LHPWQLLFHDKSIESEVVLTGEIDVTEDLVFTEKQVVTILPGTTFKLSKNRSIFFYGLVTAKGTVELPIKFEAKNSGEPWGSVVIQGKVASGSHISHIDLSGGSIAQRNLIQYPGQLNIHDVDSFQLDHCTISNNSVGDDALHIAYSSGKIQDCVFKNTDLYNLIPKNRIYGLDSYPSPLFFASNLIGSSTVPFAVTRP